MTYRTITIDLPKQPRAQECPVCKRLSAPSAQRCDCGYNFSMGRVPPERIQEQLNQLKEKLNQEQIDAERDSQSVPYYKLLILIVGIIGLLLRFYGRSYQMDDETRVMERRQVEHDRDMFARAARMQQTEMQLRESEERLRAAGPLTPPASALPQPRSMVIGGSGHTNLNGVRRAQQADGADRHHLAR